MSPSTSVNAAGMHIFAFLGRVLDHLSSPSGSSNLVTRSVMYSQKNIIEISVKIITTGINHRFILRSSNSPTQIYLQELQYIAH